MYRQRNNFHIFRGFDIGIRIGEHQQFAATRPHFLQIAFQFVEQLIIGRDHHDRHVAID